MLLMVFPLLSIVGKRWPLSASREVGKACFAELFSVYSLGKRNRTSILTPDASCSMARTWGMSLTRS